MKALILFISLFFLDVNAVEPTTKSPDVPPPIKKDYSSDLFFEQLKKKPKKAQVEILQKRIQVLLKRNSKETLTTLEYTLSITKDSQSLNALLKNISNSQYKDKITLYGAVADSCDNNPCIASFDMLKSIVPKDFLVKRIYPMIFLEANISKINEFYNCKSCDDVLTHYLKSNTDQEVKKAIQSILSLNKIYLLTSAKHLLSKKPSFTLYKCTYLRLINKYKESLACSNELKSIFGDYLSLFTEHLIGKDLNKENMSKIYSKSETLKLARFKHNVLALAIYLMKGEINKAQKIALQNYLKKPASPMSGYYLLKLAQKYNLIKTSEVSSYKKIYEDSYKNNFLEKVLSKKISKNELSKMINKHSLLYKISY